MFINNMLDLSHALVNVELFKILYQGQRKRQNRQSMQAIQFIEQNNITINNTYNITTNMKNVGNTTTTTTNTESSDNGNDDRRRWGIGRIFDLRA